MAQSRVGGTMPAGVLGLTSPSRSSAREWTAPNSQAGSPWSH